ncbi:succinylglutamate desuccinylase/aspartoacylase domain-containing protein [Haloarchaeobius iranensis]|uniref:Succinylglutamate desuccinylase n=1 Tax=Haloarchaeobius iranensis TaxID=996166 RepID=A0A1G9Y0W4_9EURY|nr:succinylglutamate desuccinylase/aspartoacylase family protein [Haloarchaeobius iranensis]SDN02712.1 Succinylglutamate desuccinylase [Haloarchaeobius iranensis]
MQVTKLGEGRAEVAVVGGIHGDEPCGIRAIERLLRDAPEVRRPVKLVVANEAAAERGVRYVEEDLNRAFPGYPDSETHEKRLAYELAHELEGCRTLALHSTQSHAEPFAVVDGVDDLARTVCPRLPVASVVETGRFVEGRIFKAVPDTIEVECGLQGTEDAAANGYLLVLSFLTATGVLPGVAPARDTPVFRLVRRIPKGPASEYEVFVENFERVDEGTTYAAVDGESVVAEEQFYPVLMSSSGYEDVFGYAADRVGYVG